MKHLGDITKMMGAELALVDVIIGGIKTTSVPSDVRLSRMP